MQGCDEVEEISKKDLLKVTGISYGQLYRWKRKSLIPDEWFMKKSTHTGQETFFPKERILERVELILNKKDNISLDDLAEHLSGNHQGEVGKTREEVERLFSVEIIRLYEEITKRHDEFTLQNLFYLSILNEMVLVETLGIEEITRMLTLLEESEEEVKAKNLSLSVYRKMGISFFILHEDHKIISSDQVPLIKNYNLDAVMSELKMRIL